MNIRRLYDGLVGGLVKFIACKADALADKVVKIQMGHRWVAYQHGDSIRLSCTCGKAEVMKDNEKFILVKGVIEQGTLQIIEIRNAQSLEDAIMFLKGGFVPYKHHD